MLRHWIPRIIVVLFVAAFGFLIFSLIFRTSTVESSEGALNDAAPAAYQGEIVDAPYFVEVIDSNDRTDARDAVNEYLRGIPRDCITDIELEIGNKYVDNFVFYIERIC